MNSRHTFGQECLYADDTEQAGHGRKSADSIYYIFRLKPHIRLKDGEERAEGQTGRRSGEHAQSHIAAIFPLALLDNDVVDSRCDVSTWKQTWCFTVTPSAQRMSEPVFTLVVVGIGSGVGLPVRSVNDLRCVWGRCNVVPIRTGSVNLHRYDKRNHTKDPGDL